MRACASAHAYNPTIWEAEEVLSSTEPQSKMLVNKNTLPTNQTNKKKKDKSFPFTTLTLPSPSPSPSERRKGGEGRGEGSKAIGQETEN